MGRARKQAGRSRIPGSAPAEAGGSGGASNVEWLTVVGARQNNLRNLTVGIPLGRFVCVTGVSGSGKSSLVNDIIAETLARDLNGAEKVRPGLHDRIDGMKHLDKVISIDQSPIGRTPRSNPGTYIKVFDEVRAMYARLPDSKVRGYKPGRFSFNVPTGRKGGGRCEACEGNGQNRMEMDFLADIWVTCPVCAGRRFNRETLQILFKGRSIADVLNMDVQDAMVHFENVPKIARMLRTLSEVGLDYLKLGQSSTTLSGGEAQRIKLARELVKRSTGRTMYVLDEPTTGLHFDDIKKLLAVLHRFVDSGNTVIVIEHNLDVIKTADWVIDLGPEGGAGGGRVLVEGTPERVARSKRSFTGAALRDVLEARGGSRRNGAGRTCGASIKRKRSAAQAVERQTAITVVGARQHNLKDITVSVPRGKTTVCCGPSGSGKSSFAIDTIYAEGQRRYVESLSAYARQFLSRLQPPSVDHIDGLSPSVCIEQKSAGRSPRSTVGTITEIYDYMRVLWARIGEPHCPSCKVPIGTQSSQEIVEKVLSLGEGARVMLLAPIEPTGQESYDHMFRRERANGYARVRIDGEVHTLDETIEIDTRRRHRVELVVDRIVIAKRQRGRVADSVEQALSVGNGVMLAAIVEPETGGANAPSGRARTDAKARSSKRRGGRSVSRASESEFRFSQHHSCDQCGRSYEELTPHHFSFNSRMGWCEACEGLGVQQGATPAAIVVHPTRSIRDGAIGGWGVLEAGSQLLVLAEALAGHIGLDLDCTWNDLPEAHRLAILHGCGDEWISLAATTQRAPAKRTRGKKVVATGSSTASTLRDVRIRWHAFFPTIHRATRSSWQYRKRLESLVTEVACDACAGGRLRRDSAAVRLGGATIHDVCLWPLSETLSWFAALKLPARERKIAGELLHEVTSRLTFLVDVGLDYVGLHRTATTLSGGESQRIQLASQIGTGLTGVLYVLDEPTIGLHPRDNARLTRALRRLRDLGNTLLVVEHDRDVIDSADHVLDFGPGAGSFGGEITAAATPKRLRSKRASLTGQYLAGVKAIPVPSNRRGVDDSVNRLTVHGARENNLKEIDVAFPLGRFTCVTGVSGSGKSTLVSAILFRALASRIHRARLVPGGHERVTGIEHIDKVINVDQSPIGISPTSNPATYTGVFDAIRELFARLPLSKVRGYTANRFSFNRPGGRCEACEGMGRQCIEMHFLPDVWIECESCGGARYVPETLDARFRGRSIADVLKMRVSEALPLFEAVPKVRRMLQTLDDVGLGYVELGQSAPTLSGGEAQRVKLAAELGRPSTGRTLYILDEPTTGLHFDDLKKLLAVLHRLVDLGNTCICIEHNLDVIKTADWVIDLGPEAGAAGGTVVVEGTPEVVAAAPSSHTGRVLAPALAAGPIEVRPDNKGPVVDALPEAERDPVELGSDVEMPWQRDGQAWHTIDHRDGKGTPVAWDAGVLLWLVETIESLGDFAPTDWAQRTRIEIKAKTGKQWFCHVLTGGKDLLDVAIRVPEGTFDASDLKRRLKLKTLDGRKDLPIYGQWDRLRCRTLTDGWDEWRLDVRDFIDVSKRAYGAFLKVAATAYLSRLEADAADPDKREPWKTDGQAWHISQRSLSKRQPVRWKPAMLMATLGRLKSIEPGLTLLWDTRTAVRFQVPGEDQVAGKIVTNIGRGLRIELRAPKNTLTPTLIDRLGEDAEIKPGPQYDRIVFWIRSLSQNDSKQLMDVWRRCRVGGMERRAQSA